MNQPTPNNPIILFDGVCNLCNSSVQFIIRNDPKHHFRFASLQSNLGQSILKQFNLPTNELSSFILLDKGKISVKSTGALKVVKQLSGAWPLLYIFIIIPAFIRDAVYEFIGRNRYKWFGKKEICWLPSPEIRALFLTEN